MWRFCSIEFMSTSFEDMSYDAFKEYFLKAIDLIEEDICPFLADCEDAAEINKIISEVRK